MNIVLYKAVISSGALAMLAATLLWLRNDARAARLSRWINIPSLWALTRLLPWLVIYMLLGFQPQSDVATAFWPQGLGASEGRLPYRDFETFFSPLFPYLLALPLLLWKDPRALILFLSVLEALTVSLTLRASDSSPSLAARARWLAFYFLAPGPLLLSVIGGQEDFLVWSGGLVLWLCFRRWREFGAGLAAVACALVTKPLFIIPAAAVLGLSRRRWHYVAAALPLALLVLVTLWLMVGREFLQVLSQTGNVTPPNIWIWIHWWSGGRFNLHLPGLSLTLVAFVVGISAAYFGFARDRIGNEIRGYFAAWTFVFALSMLLNLKSLGAYFGYFALPALALFHPLANRRALSWWVVLGTLAPIESSLWYRTREPLLTSWPNSPWVALEYCLQALMLAALIGLAWAAHRSLWATRAQTQPVQ